MASASAGPSASTDTRAPHAPGACTAAPPARGPAPPDPDDALAVEADGLVYALDATPRKGARRPAIVTVRLAAGEPGGAPTAGLGPALAPGTPLTDRCDLWSHRARLRLAGLVAETFGRATGDVLGHLALLLDRVERALDRAEARALAAPSPVALAGPRREAAEHLLAAPDLLERVARLLDALGHVGEERTKRLVYLVATSRLLEQPLSVLLHACSGAGKSAVLEAVAALLPPEAVVSLARLTATSLYYMGEHALRHKLVVVDEYEGQVEAEHAVRVLQSRGELSMSATIRGKAEGFVVRGPVAVASGTTSGRVDRQNASRCLELALDDGPEQTRRIQAAQARAWAGARPRPALERELEPFVDAQRLLEPLPVVIPFAERLTFPARTTADRRASARLLGLVAAHALLHQRQRARDAHGRVVATPADYARVHALVAGDVERDLDGLSPRAARAYQALAGEPAGEPASAGASPRPGPSPGARPVTRRELAERLGWTYMTAARALDELVAHELAAPEGRTAPRRYRLLFGAGPDGDGAGALALLPPAALAQRGSHDPRA